MLVDDYLRMSSACLKPLQEWSHASDGLHFVFPKGGAGRHVSGTASRLLAPGDVLAVNGASDGKLVAANGGEFVFTSFSAHSEALLPLFASNEVSLLGRVIKMFDRARHYPAASPLAAECQRLLRAVPSKYNLDHRSQLLRVAAAILTPELKNARERWDGFAEAEDRLIQMLGGLSRDEFLNTPIDDLAARSGCSRRHFTRLFFQRLGMSVAALRMEMRLLRAAYLLRDPDAKVEGVGQECGFNHPGLFNSTFKRRFGRSPGVWRNRRIEANHTPGPLGNGDPHCPFRVDDFCPFSHLRPKPRAARLCSGGPAASP